MTSARSLKWPLQLAQLGGAAQAFVSAPSLGLYPAYAAQVNLDTATSGQFVTTGLRGSQFHRDHRGPGPGQGGDALGAGYLAVRAPLRRSVWPIERRPR